MALDAAAIVVLLRRRTLDLGCLALTSGLSADRATGSGSAIWWRLTPYYANFSFGYEHRSA